MPDILQRHTTYHKKDKYLVLLDALGVLLLNYRASVLLRFNYTHS